MASSGDSEGLSAWLAVILAQSAVADRLEQALDAAAGMPLAWYEVLLHLSTAPNGLMKMNELARSLVISKSGVTRLIDRMAAGGVVTRRSCESDRRVVYAAITDEGRQRLALAVPVHNETVQKHFSSHLSSSEQKSIRAALRKVLAANGLTEAPCLRSAADARKAAAPAGRGRSR